MEKKMLSFEERKRIAHENFQIKEEVRLRKKDLREAERQVESAFKQSKMMEARQKKDREIFRSRAKSRLGSGQILPGIGGVRTKGFDISKKPLEYKVYRKRLFG